MIRARCVIKICLDFDKAVIPGPLRLFAFCCLFSVFSLFIN